MSTFDGHLRTVGQHLLRRFNPWGQQPLAATQRVPLPYVGRHGVSRVLQCVGDFAGSDREVVVALHGLGGSITSSYLPPLVRAARAARLSVCLINCRGARNPDGSSDPELAHAGLCVDLRTLLSSPRFAGFERVYLVGYSLGGHVALSYALNVSDPRLASVAALCAPLDLRAAAEAFDAPRLSLYRRHVLRGLIDGYVAAARVQKLPEPVERIRRVRKIVEWDSLVVAPYFGFASAYDYYERVSVAPRLAQLTRPVLYVGAGADPMVPPCVVQSSLRSLPTHSRVAFSASAGHLAFPGAFSLDEAAPQGLEPQVLGWLRRNAELTQGPGPDVTEN